MLFENLPTTKHNTLVVDPAWPIAMGAVSKTHPRNKRPAKLPYKTLTLDEIKTFPIAELANVGAHVYLWTTNRFLSDAFSVLTSWGVRFHLCMPLVKPSGICPIMQGYCFASGFCLLGFFGRPMMNFVGSGKLNWLKVTPSGGHSTKPEAFYELVASMSPAPRLDCFARKSRDGWTCWGDAIEGGIADSD